MVSLPKGVLAKAVVYTTLILLVDVLLIAVSSVILSQNMVSYYTLLTLLEAAVLLFTGGFRKPESVTPGLEPTLQRDWSLIITGLVVLALSFLLAYPLSWFFGH
jgi:hypothetical protein